MRCFRYHDWEHYHLYKSSDPSQRFAISSKEKQGASASPEKRLGKYQSQLQAIGVQGDRKKREKCVRMYVYCIVYIYIYDAYLPVVPHKAAAEVSKIGNL